MKNRNENELNKKLCKGCTYCCEYVNLPLKTPKTEEDFDHIYWYLLHKNVYVWLSRKNNWNIRFITKCKPLKNGRCRIYSKRPMLCREYDQKHCEKGNFTKDERVSFRTKKALISYLKKNKKKFFGFY